MIGKALKHGGNNLFYAELFNIYKLAESIESFSDESLTGKLELMRMCYGSADIKVREDLGAGAFVNEPLPFTYAMLLKYKDNIEGCLEAIVNMGGDSDTNASMAGAILGALYGYKAFPAKWRKRLEDRRRFWVG